MDLQIKDKVIIVTGGARGIGKGITVLLAKEGAIPVIISRTEAENIKTAEEIEAFGGKAYHIQAELSDPEACRAAVEKVIQQFGRIDGLVNNAGENDGVGLQNGSYEKFMQSLHKNLVHYYLVAHYALPELIKSQGSILNITSKVADTGQGGTSAYAASNGGRNALTREWAVELLPHNVRVNAVAVAECYTPLYERWIQTLDNPEEKLASITKNIPLGKRMTTAEEIANAAIFLLSPVSSHTTGQIVYVDGGYVHLDRSVQ
ncbi:SDR family oxidoreductase [Mucilaginibacter phyllosphaerae]|uniref:NAD(P)-dependent dehydrogenase (Short-subunit alcohol dehydrogenase family) n=1 Tax=Mucilaginibacter phyllosphaerae TaxID=1812349 RepID=A0A4Y8AIQ0_9SPHI|nr:SDR family oxidoreductase [Mucilaginibacter phyllosphaerae]MBB3968033.1 NAD(P)-dependent dehydrogenase (short-subunit alcohol dehydrogenase family) [Mucilaginibacter phyllosphaerae]TEW68943.1 SDR family oxidoreductase [Mucilaginibacter phyllosphaerae]GGH01684.1 short-chain dehydrogenase/reductase [Mucilaginibacter phyllosphaerae]